MSMTHGTNSRGSEDAGQQPPPRPPSAQSGSSSGSGSSKHVKCIGRYVLTGCTLGKGNFARVESAVHTLTRGKVAIKIIETDKIKEEYVRKNLLREAQLMRRLRHPNIIRLYETMKTNNLYCLVTEVAEGGELLSHVRNDFKEKRLSEATTRPFIRQLSSALHHLHSVGIVHRDLKMENILLDKKKRNVKIVDFGLSNAAKPGALLQTHCGSPEYAAPELFIPGREYGSEVDVWSLGVNMYAMLVGKLPFRSPRQGTKKRHKLLEQITGGISEAHEKEMGHLSHGARDLIGRLLQPDPRKRTTLEEVMNHPWVTKDGTHLLSPYRHVPPDTSTQSAVVELMATVLELSPGEIKETVRRDRCDWIAAIYNLLMDQPEGRNILQRLVTDDPSDQLVDAAHYQTSSTEHIRLSQGDTLDKTPPDVASVLTGATAPGKSGYRHSLSHSGAESSEHDYNSATLPLTKKERRRHHSQDMRPLGAPRVLNPVNPPPGYMLRRASVAGPHTSPEHHGHYHQQHYQHHHHQPIIGDHHYHGHHHHNHRGSATGRRLPMTPNEEPYYRHHQHQDVPMRPHSRAESAPDHPLPTPWRPTLAPRNQLIQSPTAISPSASPPPTARSPLEEYHHKSSSSSSSSSSKKPNFKEPLVSPLTKPFKKKGNLNPIRQKSASLGGKQHLSGSIDAHLHLRGISHPTSPHNMAAVVHPAAQGLSRHHSIGPGTQVQVGWASSNNFHYPPSRASGSASIQSLMRNGHPPSPYMSIQDDNNATADSGSTTSVAIKQELFAMSVISGGSTPSPQGTSPQASIGPSPHTSNAHFRSSGDNLKVDPISGGEMSHKRHHPYTNHGHSGHLNQHQHNHHHVHVAKRSISAKPMRPQSMYEELPPELSSSVGHITGPAAEHHNHINHGHENGTEEEVLGIRGSGPTGGGGLLGKLKSKNKEKNTATTH